jgi:nitroreductase
MVRFLQTTNGRIMDFRDIVDGRRSVNFFDPEKPVPEVLLREMIKMAAKAPSSLNLQPWSLLIFCPESDDIGKTGGTRKRKATG